MRLTREIRCTPADALEEGGRERPRNTWAGSAGADALAPFWRLRATAEGEPDPTTGYLCDIRDIDDLLRGSVMSEIMRHLEDGATPALEAALVAMRRAAPADIDVVGLELEITPFTRYTAYRKDRETVQTITRQYEFSAAHRLFVEGFSDDENRRIFGKCSNPHGHGHNYVVEVSVQAPSSAPAGEAPTVDQLDRIVAEKVIEPLDHKNLNLEIEEFTDLNPSVENIARVIFRRLGGALPDGALHNVRVYETPKTWADCTRAR